MEINKLKERAYNIALKHGWYDEERSMIERTMMVLTELCEAINADRNGKHADRERFESYMTASPNSVRGFMFCFGRYIKDTLEDEFADAVIRILTIAGQEKATLSEDVFSEESISEGVRIAEDSRKNGFYNRVVTLPEELFLVAVPLLTSGPGEDMLFSLLVIAKSRGIDIEWHIEQKMKYNEFRSYKHGNKKY